MTVDCLIKTDMTDKCIKDSVSQHLRNQYIECEWWANKHGYSLESCFHRQERTLLLDNDPRTVLSISADLVDGLYWQ
jgi:hypothetical protein